MGRHRTPQEKVELGKRARALRSAGQSRREIAAELQLAPLPAHVRLAQGRGQHHVDRSDPSVVGTGPASAGQSSIGTITSAGPRPVTAS